MFALPIGLSGSKSVTGDKPQVVWRQTGCFLEVPVLEWILMEINGKPQLCFPYYSLKFFLFGNPREILALQRTTRKNGRT